MVEGIHTSIPMHQRILADPDFQAGNFDTNFIKRFCAEPTAVSGMSSLAWWRASEAIVHKPGNKGS